MSNRFMSKGLRPLLINFFYTKGFYLFSILFFMVCLWLFITILVAHLPYSPVSVSKKTTKYLQAFVPQGWAFFTRDPKEQQVYMYQVKNSSVENINYRSGDPGFLFGATKTSRMQMFELSILFKEIPDSIWVTSRGNFENTALLKKINPFNVVNKSLLRSVTGLVVIEKIDPIPWAWIKRVKKVKMPGKFVYLNIE